MALGGGGPSVAYSSFCENRVETADRTLMVLCKVCTTSCLEDPRAQEAARAHRRLLPAQARRVCLLETFSPRFSQLLMRDHTPSIYEFAAH